ncbi:aspartate aminotransferase family protein [Alteromonas sp. C1M14]|uniref:aspartate aminotransferase family protein n=1 Tax=Alteromonas sp. C1M14 TaxID=2841567 RepID=UPI001C084F70|nr:aspartate aminotransferase family protein [Alteromonas sp. C1M14]MBU2978541.1 aspartate aminotransferase family protein [Alteromonas sp. C1M14]
MHNTTAHLAQLDAQHFIHPFTNSGELAAKGTRIIDRAEGIYIYDTQGQELIDGMAGLWCVNVGYSRQELVDAAMSQMQQLPYYNSFFQCTTPPAIALSEILSEVAPKHINNVFYCNSGSEANDTVLRMARHYWACQGLASKQVIISRHNAYHGSTVAGASLGGMSAMHKQGGLPIPGIEHIDQPYWFGEGFDRDPQVFGKQIALQLEAKIIALGEDKVAAFIAEPIQGAGGVIIPPATYWPEIKRICQQYNILLVCDEVICGFGRTGEWFGSEYFDVEADLMPIAKGLSSGYMPIGGVLTADRVAEVLKTKGGEFNHGFTYSGHPVAAAVALANVNILRNEGIVDKVKAEVGPYFQQQIRKLGDHPLIGEARGVGLLGAFELMADKTAHEFFPDKGRVGTLCRDLAIKNGIVMRHVGSTMVLSPPLVISCGQIDELFARIKLTFDEVAEKVLN